MSLDRTISRRTVFKGAGGLAAASIIGAGAAWSGVTPAHAAGLEVTDHATDGRMETYTFSSPSFSGVTPPLSPAGSNPHANVLLPADYASSGKRYPVLYLFHGGGGNYTQYDRELNIRAMTEGRDLIVVMPDAGVSWHCNPVSARNRKRDWETFQIEELIPWVDATFRTFPEQAGRAVSGFSMGGFGALKYIAKYSDKFASVSAHSGPANLRSKAVEGIVPNLIIAWANLTSHAEFGQPVYGRWPRWHQDLITADNPIENIESYRNKRIFLVAGTSRVSDIPQVGTIINTLTEDTVLNTQREFAAALDSAGIKYERFEEPGGHIIRPERLQQDIDGVVAHLHKAE
jgi:uncharacterized protein rv1288/MT1326